MITEKTVFVLGAGASKPYGFPTALELRKNIIYDFPDMFKSSFAEFNGVPLDKVDLRKDLEELINTFKYSSTKSIDLFLSRNKRFYEIGKRIAAYLIADCETKSKFREDIEEPKFDWYMHLFDFLTKEISNPEGIISLLENNQVSFISFNYDRSLEHFIHESLFNSFTTKRNEIKSLICKIKIQHVYGKISALPWENNSSGIKYGNPEYFGFLENLENNIRIIFEERTDDLSEAKQLISEAQRIFFLGFGYADENLEALEFNKLISQSHNIYGTGLGLTDSERNRVVSKLKGNKREIVSSRFIIDDCDSVMLLRKYL